MEESFNKKFPYIKWKDMVCEGDTYKHTLTERVFSYNGEWKELKSKPSPPVYNKLTVFDKFIRFIFCYQEYTIMI